MDLLTNLIVVIIFTKMLLQNHHVIPDDMPVWMGKSNKAPQGDEEELQAIYGCWERGNQSSPDMSPLGMSP